MEYQTLIECYVHGIINQSPGVCMNTLFLCQNGEPHATLSIASYFSTIDKQL